MSGPRKRDSGLQPERTLLSWQRTLFLLIAVALLYLRIPAESIPAGVFGQMAVVFTPLGAAIVLTAHLRLRWRRTDHGLHDESLGTPPAPLARPWTLILLSVAVMGLGTATILTAVPR
ncbi:DUF202 domain-containing protein [Thermobifida halotolerans]|uniref:DUF202 domain-containing protein n=1 Tax=Thermobifida halotolerans TaxID=483545 RepID=A0A399G1D4_9ACTN|nr:DUF202 domain-containing protein [Thermobifida halotolerans]UOE19235.1 DUF202 domain-containing protein [Thermobifida halotolerans]